MRSRNRRGTRERWTLTTVLEMSSWLNQYLFAIPVKEFTHYRRCDVDGAGRMCSMLNNTLAYAVDLNSTVDIVKEVPAYRRIGNETTVTVAFRRFQCIETKPAKELDVPEGSWSDRLVVSDRPDSKCLTKEEWLKHARSGCGKEPTNYTLVGKCGKNETFLEMIFVCDRAPAKLNRSLDNSHWETTLDKHQETLYSLLNSYTAAFKEFATTKTGDPKHLSAMYNLMLFGGEIRLKLLAEQTWSIEAMKEYHGHEYTSDVISRRKMKDDLKVAVSDWLHGRTSLLIAMAAANVAGTNMEVMFPSVSMSPLKMFDVEEYFSVSRKVLGEARKGWMVFPELKADIEKFYIDFCKNHTLGIAPRHLDFLSKPNAHEKIEKIYSEIFSPVQIDKKYLHVENRFVAHYAYVSALVLVTAVLSLTFWWIRKKNGSVGDVTVAFGNLKNRFANEDKMHIVMDDVET
ncbi:hypothetical protein QR680_003831 [Steinernema hermaphroditum]|uniref:Uncharacterized protein n=1 Tax=Steinernema hermaphroditum TaxID=289476 RepID=A0AA39HNZ5_9BILA|nr:hypothetical protein QR680_003831 [Steinernema hermaphroditum]